jgi:predicted small metal-binding protein
MWLDGFCKFEQELMQKIVGHALVMESKRSPDLAAKVKSKIKDQ